MKIEDYIDKTSEELEKMTTAQLLMLRKMCFASFRTCGCASGNCEVYGKDAEYNKRLGAVQARVMAILPTREHYPNKAERKAARQARAKRSK